MLGLLLSAYLLSVSYAADRCGAWLTGVNYPQYSECYSHYNRVELGLFNLLRSEKEHRELLGQSVAIFLQKPFKEGQTQIIEGKLISAPILRKDSEKYYVVEDKKGFKIQIPANHIGEMRVECSKKEVNFQEEYANWEKIPLGLWNLPQRWEDRKRLLRRKVAFLVKKGPNKTEIIEGALHSIPKKDSTSENTYRILNTDGSQTSIPFLDVVELRLKVR